MHRDEIIQTYRQGRHYRAGAGGIWAGLPFSLARAHTHPLLRVQMHERVFNLCKPVSCATYHKQSIWAALLKGLGTVSLIATLATISAQLFYVSCRKPETPFELDECGGQFLPLPHSAGSPSLPTPRCSESSECGEHCEMFL